MSKTTIPKRTITRNTNLTQSRLKEILNYDPETGLFIREKTRGNSVKGAIAGCFNKCDGYKYICVDGVSYNASRLAFLWMEGYFPEHEIDHRNRIKDDNRWCNLRHVTHFCNSRNCKKSKNNKSGIVGVSWDKRKKWCSQIMVNGRHIHLGLFTTIREAVKARWEAEVKYGYPNCNTTSSAYQYLNTSLTRG